jgi:hypothetical protein
LSPSLLWKRETRESKDHSKERKSKMAEIANAVVRVGDGRGFVVEGATGQRFIITAAHCLPFVPPSHGFSYTEERTYQNLLARLGQEPSVWCECLFLDPIADIAVLGTPDNQELFEQADAYEALVEDEAVTPFTVAEPPGKPMAEQAARLAKIGVGEEEAMRECLASMLFLDGVWRECRVQYQPNGMLITYSSDRIAGGMSGSPIVAESGAPIGVVCLGMEGSPHITECGGPHPRLMGNLPGWFLETLNAA